MSMPLWAWLISPFLTGLAQFGSDTNIVGQIGPATGGGVNTPVAPIGGTDGGSPTPDSKRSANYWLAGLALAGVSIAAAPTLYKAYALSLKGKKAKKASQVGEGLEYAANRATTIAAALLPAMGLPITYITVQALEDRGVISKGLGDAVQTMLAAGAVAPAIGAVAGFAGKLVK